MKREEEKDRGRRSEQAWGEARVQEEGWEGECERGEQRGERGGGRGEGSREREGEKREETERIKDSAALDGAAGETDPMA